MLINSNYVDSTQAVELNKLAEEYNSISIQASDLEKRKKELSTKIKEICNKGGIFETTKWLVTVSEMKGRAKTDYTMLQEDYPEVYDKVVSFGNDYLQISSVKSNK